MGVQRAPDERPQEVEGDLLLKGVTGKETSVVTADSGSYNKKDQTLDARGNVVATASNGKVLK